MSRPIMNPHLDLSDMVQAFPPGHPGREQPMLTPYQQMALPMLLWLLDPQRHRGEGRSTVLAHAVIELAMRGYSVPLEDLSQFINQHSEHRTRGYFMDLVARIAHEHYPGHIFNIGSVQNFRHGDGRLQYVGRRPR